MWRRGFDGFVVRDVSPKQGFEEPTVNGDFQVKEFVDDDVFAEGGGLDEQVHAE